jgi:hypothetical protein
VSWRLFEAAGGSATVVFVGLPVGAAFAASYFQRHAYNGTFMYVSSANCSLDSLEILTAIYRTQWSSARHTSLWRRWLVSLFHTMVTIGQGTRPSYSTTLTRVAKSHKCLGITRGAQVSDTDIIVIVEHCSACGSSTLLRDTRCSTEPDFVRA